MQRSVLEGLFQQLCAHHGSRGRDPSEESVLNPPGGREPLTEYGDQHGEMASLKLYGGFVTERSGECNPLAQKANVFW